MSKTLSDFITTEVDKTTGEILLSACPRVKCFMYCPSSKQRWALPCKSRQCDYCGKIWSNQWRYALKLQADHTAQFNLPPVTLALTLTYAENAGHKQVHACLRYFWQLVRKSYPVIQYWGVVEFNQKHTLPHLHFVLSGYSFIPYQFIVVCWETAQYWAKINAIAFICRIETICGNAQAYFTKYITKLVGYKDEVPRRENWKGRYVRYSAKFFPVGLPAMRLATRLNKMFHVQQTILKMAIYSPLSRLFPDIWLNLQDKMFHVQQLAINADWQPENDKARAVPALSWWRPLPRLDDKVGVLLTTQPEIC